jgi:hypothetical protein
MEQIEPDVQDTHALKKYMVKRTEWLSWYSLCNEEPNSLQQQISSMMVLDMAYRTLAEPRKTADADRPSAAKTPLLVHFLDQGYVATQVLAIRKLLDKGKDVISIKRLLDDIRANADLITREIYVSHDGLPYDPAAWQNDASCRHDMEVLIWGRDAPGLSAYSQSRHRHEMFDELSGVDLVRRSRFDRIQVRIFDEIDKWINESGAPDIIKLGNKFIAHAADPKSRSSLANEGITFEVIDRIHRAIIRAERAITDDILFIDTSRDVVPILDPSGFLIGLDSPYAGGNLAEIMYQRWDELKKQREVWKRPAGRFGKL